MYRYVGRYDIDSIEKSHAGGTVSMSDDAKTQPYEGGEQNVGSKHEVDIFFLYSSSFGRSGALLVSILQIPLSVTFSALRSRHVNNAMDIRLAYVHGAMVSRMS